MNLNFITSLIVIAVFLTHSAICLGQTTKTKYYADELFLVEVPEEDAVFSISDITHSDGARTTETKNIKKGEVIRSRTYRNAEPFGVWITRSNGKVVTLNYDFYIDFSEVKCTDSLRMKIMYEYSDDSTAGYKAPIITSSGMTDLTRYIASKLVYPEPAIKRNIEGMVVLTYGITKEGKTDNIRVVEMADILLTKEAVRVIRELTFESPPMLNGEACSIGCLVVPIRFSLR